jgi:dienelactone hydrolase
MIVRHRTKWICGFAFWLGFTAVEAAAADFTFTVNPATNTFTYSDAQRTFGGIFIKPAGNGPFPAVIINHGQGGTPGSYSRPKANEMSAWGLACIGPELTHIAGGETAPETTGNCPENVARGEACLNALVSLNYVDPSRIAIFGHSKGAYATIGQVAALTSRLKAAGMTAGGIVPDGAGTSNAAPTTTEANPIRTPFIMFHGATDPTVSPSFSLSFRNLLTGLGVPNDRILYDVAAYTPNEQHNIHQIPSINADFLTKLRAWFITHGVLPLSIGSSQGGTSLGAFAGNAFGITLTATGGTGPYTWTFVSGTLPAGVMLDSGGTMSGTASASGTFTFTAKATDSTGGSTLQTFTLTIFAAPTPPEVSRNGDGSMRLDWMTDIGLTYLVEFSEDLAEWLPASSPFTATLSTVSWIDDGTGTGTLPSSHFHRYYRLRASR